jgi:integrase
MPIELYRRHSDKCKKYLTETLNLPVKAHRSYTDCQCWIWIEGTKENGEVLERQSTATRDWKAAEAIRNQHESSGKDTALHGLTLAAVIQKYTDSLDRSMKPKAKGQYELVLGWLKDFAHQRNKMFAAELTVDLIEDFKTYGWPKSINADTTKATYTSKIRRFLKVAEIRGWVKESLVAKVEPYAAQYEEKQPYTAEEVTAIFDEADKLNGGTSGYATNAETFVLLLKLMHQTGMRVSDAIRYDPRKCEKDDFMFVYTFKPRKQRKASKQKTAEVYLTEELKTTIDQCKWFSVRFPFAYRLPAKDGETDYLAQAVYERMQEIGKRCKDGEGNPAPIEDCRPHRLRDTFAVDRLTEGYALEDVSRLLYHSSITVTERYYAPWVKDRKKRLQKMMYESLVKN